jgi:hypothetical protein
MGIFNKDDKVIRLNKSGYDLNKTKAILQQHFPNISHSSTVDGVDGSEIVLYADQDGAVIQYMQTGSNYNGKLGYLYYTNKYLEQVKRLEEVINDYAIY